MSWKKENIRKVIHEPISGEWGDEGDQVHVIRTTNFCNDGSLDLSELVTRNISISKVQKKKLLFGDTILEKSGGSLNQPVGRVVYFNVRENGKEYLCNNFTTIIRAQNNVDSKYLFWFLFQNHSSKQTLKYQNKTTGILNLKTERYLDDLYIPLPPISTQQKIAAILDKADELRRKDKALLEKYDALLQSIFYKMFGDPVKNEKGWEKGTIRDVVTEVKYGTSKPAEDEGEYPYLRMNNITYNGEWNFADLKYINLSEAEKDKYILKKNDLVFNRTNSKELVGKTAVFDVDEEMAIAGYLIKVRTNEKANPYYLSGYLNSKHGKLTLMSMCKNIIGMANINAQELQDIRILIPSVDLQNTYADLVKHIGFQKRLIKKQIEQSGNLFQSLLQKAFKGELVN